MKAPKMALEQKYQLIDWLLRNQILWRGWSDGDSDDGIVTDQFKRRECLVKAMHDQGLLDKSIGTYEIDLTDLISEARRRRRGDHNRPKE